MHHHAIMAAVAGVVLAVGAFFMSPTETAVTPAKPAAAASAAVSDVAKTANAAFRPAV